MREHEDKTRFENVDFDDFLKLLKNTIWKCKGFIAFGEIVRELKLQLHYF